MYECHAVVILLSDAALCSDWVRSEAVVVSNRRRNESNFRLIAVPLETVTAQSIAADPVLGGVARLTDFQLLRDCTDDEDIVCKLKISLEGLRPTDSPFEGLVDLVRDILDGIHVSSENFVKTASLTC